MTVAVIVLVVLLIAVVVWVVGGPLRRRGQPYSAGQEREELEAAREVKYRELRDLELDYQTGKLSDEDYAALDRTLRAEAIEILRRLDELD